MIIRELIIGEEEDGVKAISLVTDPAIESNFIHFNNEVKLRIADLGNGYILDLDKFWKYTAFPEPEIIDTSHKWCKVKAGNVYHISEIRGWDSAKSNKDYGFIQESNYFKTFNGVYSTSFNIDKQIYNCRHSFRKVRNVNEVPHYKQLQHRKKAFSKIEPKTKMDTIQFKVDKEKREIVGLALIPNMMIYRSNIGDTGEDGYVWLSKKSIKKIKELYGYNRTLTIEHSADITGTAILLDSWIYPDDKDETYNIEEVVEGSWFLRYKIIDDALWEVIKNEAVLGFSIEAMFNLREPQ